MVLKISRGLLILVCCLLAGCYHMRLYPQGVEGVQLTLPTAARGGVPRIAHILQQDGFMLTRSSERDGAIETDYRYITTETGFGQPVEGRRYYYKLKLVMTPRDKGVLVALEPAALEIRTHYVENVGGDVQELEKYYPFEQYPGMFELRYLREELQRVSRLLERNLAAGGAR